MQATDETGNKYGRLLVLYRDFVGGVACKAVWRCLCQCGNTVSASGSDLRTGNTKSCGCLKRDNCIRGQKLAAEKRVTHGKSRTRTYRSWQAMKRRCNKPNYEQYKDYGGRGIRYCPEWESFEQFWADMGERPAGTTLDRIDNDGNYEPCNCRWATPKEQQRDNYWSRMCKQSS